MNGLVVQMCWEQQQPDIIIPSMSGWEGLVGENHHNMTSYSLTISYVFMWLLFILFWLRLLNALASLLPPKPLGGVTVQNELVWKGFDIETLSLPHEEIFFFFFYKRLCSHPFLCISATVSPGWATALPLIGVRLTCLWAKPSCWASLFNL